jgi:hypothetical protein
MHEFSISHWVTILAVILILWFGREIREVLRHLVEGPRGGPPQFPNASAQPRRPFRNHLIFSWAQLQP